MSDAFDYDGFWWDPQHPETMWTGTLRFDRVEGARLRLIVPSEVSLAQWVAGGLRRYDILLGTTTSGKDVTLIQCFDMSHGGVLGGPHIREIFANQLIVGFHAAAADPVVSRLSVGFAHLNDWWGESAIIHDGPFQFPNVALRYSQPAPVVLFDTNSIKVTVWSGCSPYLKVFSASLREEVRMDIEATAIQTLAALRRVADSLSGFLSVACLTLCRADDIQVFADDETSQADGTFHAVPLYKRAPREKTPDLLFRLDDIRARASEIFTRWLSIAEVLRPVLTLYFSGAYAEGFVEGKLFSFTQALEAFHRRFYEGTYLTGAAFSENVLPCLVSAIPDTLDDPFRDALKTRLRFANEASLRKRLAELFMEHEEALATVAPDPRRFIGPVVALRNVFTHQPTGAEGPSPTPEEIVAANAVLKILLEMCFLKVMGFTPAERLDLAKRCIHYRRISQRFF